MFNNFSSVLYLGIILKKKKKSKLKQEPQTMLYNTYPSLLLQHIPLLSSKIVHKETHLDGQYFFFSKFQANIKGWYLHYYWLLFSILYAWQNFWVQIKTKANLPQPVSDKKPENEYKCDMSTLCCQRDIKWSQHKWETLQSLSISADSSSDGSS